MLPLVTHPPTEAPRAQDDLWLLAALAEEEALDVRFEPIVQASSGAVHGLEALCRVRHGELPLQTRSLFRLAEEAECATELSEILRRHAAAAMADPGIRLFVNTHPAELRDISRLLFSLDELRGRWPELRLVLEVHEEAEPTIEELKLLRRELARLRVEVAYDDFGSGRARLRELVEVPPDYVKLDHRLVHSLTDDRESVRGVVQAILDMATSVGARVIAEGLACEEEELLCRRLGFVLVQRHVMSDAAARVAGHRGPLGVVPCLATCA